MSLIYFIISNILGCFAPRLDKMIYLYLFIFCSLSLLLSPSSFSLLFLMALWHHIVPPPLFVVIFPPSSFCCFPLSVFHSWFSLHATLSVYIHISIPDTRHDSRFLIPCVALFLSFFLSCSLARRPIPPSPVTALTPTPYCLMCITITPGCGAASRCVQ